MDIYIITALQSSSNNIFPLRKNLWEENSSKEIPHLYSVTALGWKRDGSRVAAGSLCGGVELFESVLKRAVWNNKFEMT